MQTLDTLTASLLTRLQAKFRPSAFTTPFHATTTRLYVDLTPEIGLVTHPRFTTPLRSSQRLRIASLSDQALLRSPRARRAECLNTRSNKRPSSPISRQGTFELVRLSYPLALG